MAILQGSFDHSIKIGEVKCDGLHYDAEHRGWTVRENGDLTAVAAAGVSGFAR